MTLPRVVIVGRPNVGKSTLLNRLAGSRVAIVEPTEGVTRDRVAVRARLTGRFGERWVELIDTGGVGIVDRDDLGPLVEEQIERAIRAADLVLFVVDARAGITPLDQEVARRLRGLERPIELVCNKVEGDRVAWEVDAFRSLGIGGDPLPISAQNGDGIARLVERIVERLPEASSTEAPARPVLKLAIVGRRNVGKSTLVNALAREERVIVSEVPGTTRDALDIVIERDGESFVLIDTAGLRKRKSHADAIEFFSDARSRRAIRRADVVVLLFDATEPLSGIEKSLARYVTEHYKLVILAANKWDLVQGVEPEAFGDYLERELPGIAWAPAVFLSAKEGKNVFELLDLARELHRQASGRVSTGELNRVLSSALEARSPSARGQRVRILYATQVERVPPTFVLFVNDKRLVGREFLRYLEHRIRAEFAFDEVPLRFVLRDKRPETVPGQKESS
jgi:GTP-binding protein